MSTALLGMGVSALVLIGWAFGFAPLETVFLPSASMKANTAFCLLQISVALFLAHSHPRLSQALGAFACLNGAATLAQYLGGWDLGIDELLVRDSSGSTLFPGRMAPPAALGIVWLGAALFLAPLGRRGAIASQALGGLAAADGILALTGYFYGFPVVSGFPGDAGMALHTSVLLAALGQATATLYLERGPLRILLSQSDGGRMARWMVPGSILIPLIVGRIKLAGYNHGLYENALGSALFAVVTAGMFLSLVWAAAIWLDRLEKDRISALEDALQSNTRYRRLVESNIIGISTAETNGRVIEANDEYLRIHGFSRTDLLAGRVHWDFTQSAADQAASDLAFAHTAAQGSAQPWEREIVRKDGSRIPILMGVAQLAEKGSPTIAFSLDLSERKRAEAERDRYFTLSLELLCVANTDGFFRRLNPAFERTLGYSQEELLGRPFIDYVHVEDRPSTLVQVELLKKGANVVGFENRYRRKDGTYCWLLWSATASPEGAIFAAARDITERKRTEEELQRTVAELARSNNELEQFAYIASHDLQEPLRAVAGCVQILQQRYKGQLDARADELIGHVVDGATRMKSLINDLITFSRVGRSPELAVSVDLNVCLQNARLNLRTALEESTATLTAEPLPTVQGNATQLTQLLQNLLSNALKFHGTEPPQIHIHATRREADWLIAVADKGIGIDPQYFERIFGVFQRLHTRREFEGTGIGLAVCKKIVERHQGKIWLESVPGKGSTFFFSLPFEQPHSA